MEGEGMELTPLGPIPVTEALTVSPQHYGIEYRIGAKGFMGLMEFMKAMDDED